MEYTLENTKDATQARVLNSGITFYIQGRGNFDCHQAQMLFCTYQNKWVFSGVAHNFRAMIQLGRPHNETKEYWTSSNGVTKYAQPIKTLRVHAAMTAEFMSDDRINIDLTDTDAERLYSMLDDIDTLSDSIKPIDLESYKSFYKHAIDFANKRHLIFYTDGFGILNKEKETTMQQKPFHDPDSYLARECIDESFSAVADDKPVFTQAMADNNELPPIGSYFIVTNLEGDSRLGDFFDLKVEVIGLCEFDKSETVVTFKHPVHGVGCGMYGKEYASWAKTIQTDEDKLREVMLLIAKGCDRPHSVVNGFLASDKFTITLNG